MWAPECVYVPCYFEDGVEFRWVYMLEFHLITFGFLFIFPLIVLVLWNPL